LFLSRERRALRAPAPYSFHTGPAVSSDPHHCPPPVAKVRHHHHKLLQIKVQSSDIVQQIISSAGAVRALGPPLQIRLTLASGIISFAPSAKD
jgi:hypothetical protein